MVYVKKNLNFFINKNYSLLTEPHVLLRVVFSVVQKRQPVCTIPTTQTDAII